MSKVSHSYRISDIIDDHRRKRRARLIEFLSTQTAPVVLSADDAEKLYDSLSAEERLHLETEYNKAAFGIYAEEESEEEKKREEYKEYIASIPERYRDAEISDFETSKIYPYISEALSSKRNWLVMGSNGTGKTRLSYAFCKEWKKKGESFAYITATRLSSQVRQWIMSGYDVCEAMTSNYGWQAHLVIDEMDKASGGSFASYFSDLIDYRYSRYRQTIVLGNIENGQSAIEIIGKSAYSRLKGEEAVQSCNWTDKDRRLIGK